MIKKDLIANAYDGNIKGLIYGFIFSPAIRLISLFRIAQYFKNKGKLGKILSKIFWRSSVSNSSCYISVDSKIGEGLCLPHPTSIIIGDGVEIGENVTIFQNVTFGRANKEKASYPKIEDNVTIYCGAVILGDIIIGKNAIIGANSVVTKSIPENAIAAGIPARIIKTS